MKTRSIILILILTIQCSFAQDHPPKSDASKPVAGGGTPVPFTRATVISVRPSQEVVLKLSDGSIRPFKFAISAPCFDNNGALMEGCLISKGSRVLVHFMTEDGKSIVDRLIVQP